MKFWKFDKLIVSGLGTHWWSRKYLSCWIIVFSFIILKSPMRGLLFDHTHIFLFISGSNFPFYFTLRIVVFFSLFSAINYINLPQHILNDENINTSNLNQIIVNAATNAIGWSLNILIRCCSWFSTIGST